MYKYSLLYLNFWAEGNIFTATTLRISYTRTAGRMRIILYI
jgi:hypothetical protein